MVAIFGEVNPNWGIFKGFTIPNEKNMVNGQLCGCRGQISKSTWFGAGPRACTVHCAHGAGRLKAEDRRSAEDRESEGKFHGTPPCEKWQKTGD